MSAEWELLGETSLSSSGESLQLTSLSAKDYLQITFDLFPSGSNNSANLRFNNDSSGTSYSRRENQDFSTTDGLGTNRDKIDFVGGSTGGCLAQIFVGQADGEVKLCYCQIVDKVTTGTGAAANIGEARYVWGKWTNKTTYINQVDIFDDGYTGGWAAGSNMCVYGADNQ